ncbi:type IV secretory system conjugative DNA transfer family protein [Deinococcus ruber]|nr:TraM recognition domain-containing protein [Deinococcus ruber]
MGQLITVPEVQPNKGKPKLITAPPPLLLPREPWCQNTIVQGGVGSGKTTGFFQANGALAAHLGQTLILIDTKWPQSDSGLREMLGYWKAMGRDVQLYTPFEANSLRLPMDDSIGSFEEGLRFADAVMPPPEFIEERGAHFKQTQRRVLAAQARVNARRGGNLESLLDIALMTLEQHKEWVKGITDPDEAGDPTELDMLSRIMYGALSRGDKDFMDSMAAIISALRVFFNPAVMRATTAGSPDETIVLETAFRKPTLIYFAVNQEDMLDGSGTILIRLFFRRMVQAVFRVAKSSPGGKLPHLATCQMDEQPSYGRINYLMRISATMRSYRFAIVFGIQNNAQGQLVYGREYWEAISENVIARRIVFPRGLSGKDAEDISHRIGMTTAARTSSGVSNSQSLLGGDQRTTTTSTLQSQPLLPVEEFPSFSIGEAVIISPHHAPIRSAFTPITFEHVLNPAVQKGAANWIHGFYREMMERVPSGMALSEYSNRLIEQGIFTRLTPLQQARNMAELNGFAVVPAEPPTVNSRAEQIAARFTDWMQEVLETGAEVLLSGMTDRHIDLTLTTLKAEGNTDSFVAAKLLDRISAHTVRVSERGRAVLGPATLLRLRDMHLLYPIWTYLEKNGALIEQHPLREALPEDQRAPAVGRLEQDGQLLKLVRSEARTIYPTNVPAFTVTQDGNGTRSRWLNIPVNDAQAIRSAMLAQEEREQMKGAEAEKKMAEKTRLFSRAEGQ